MYHRLDVMGTNIAKMKIALTDKLLEVLESSTISYNSFDRSV